MKKLLRPLFTILLLGLGFLYIVKNPELPISQKILSTFNIDLTTETPVEEIDLTHCLTYFDGCNTCMVSGGVIGGCTKMFCETPSEPYCMEYERTGMDLTNCISYFDGCNNCSVENGRPSACTLMYCETPGEPKCNEYAMDSDEGGVTSDEKGDNINAIPPNGDPVFCTMDAKECPDGSYVSRVAPDCEFAPCPEN